MNENDRVNLDAAAFRRLVQHLRSRPDVQNIDLMNLAGFCRNCLGKWYKAAADDLEELVASRMEGDAPGTGLAGPVPHGEGAVIGRIAFGAQPPGWRADGPLGGRTVFNGGRGRIGKMDEGRHGRHRAE